MLLKEWLAKYKFKNWKVTDKRGVAVTRAMREQRAQEIAERLNNTEDWHSHSRGIPMAVLRRKLKLLIDDFGVDSRFDPLHDYYRLLQDYVLLRDHDVLALHRNGRYVGV